MLLFVLSFISSFCVSCQLMHIYIRYSWWVFMWNSFLSACELFLCTNIVVCNIYFCMLIYSTFAFKAIILLAFLQILLNTLLHFTLEALRLPNKCRYESSALYLRLFIFCIIFKFEMGHTFHFKTINKVMLGYVGKL